ncbi:MAG: hypothetical protein EBX54_12550, partial [Betaproteobacteria bacterium]|nr:hypothetical protein [Betaproteobacteria bacterium]
PTGRARLYLGKQQRQHDFGTRCGQSSARRGAVSARAGDESASRHPLDRTDQRGGRRALCAARRKAIAR